MYYISMPHLCMYYMSILWSLWQYRQLKDAPARTIQFFLRWNQWCFHADLSCLAWKSQSLPYFWTGICKTRELIHSCHGILLPIQLLGILDEHFFFFSNKKNRGIETIYSLSQYVMWNLPALDICRLERMILVKLPLTLRQWSKEVVPNCKTR